MGFGNSFLEELRLKALEEHAEEFSSMESRAERLLRVALQFNNSEEKERFGSTHVVREEFGRSEDFFLKRGYYCPSPVRDLIVVNCKRGKLLKRASSGSRVTHRYLHGEQGLMIVEEIADGKCFQREYLLREAQKIIGISIRGAGHIHEVVEELFADGKITEYFHAVFEEIYGSSGEYRTTRTELEQYFYDEQGLVRCNINRASHGCRAVINCDTYYFNRVDGYLQSFYRQPHSSEPYTPKVKRLALPPYFVE